jgi:hypothetical protein
MPVAYLIVWITITREEGWPEYRHKVLSSACQTISR